MFISLIFRLFYDTRDIKENKNGSLYKSLRVHMCMYSIAQHIFNISDLVLLSPTKKKHNSIA